MFTFTGPYLPYGLFAINQAMVTSPDGLSIIIFGGFNDDSRSSENRILQSRFDGSKFLPWQVLASIGRWKWWIDGMKDGRRHGHVVIPIPKSITNCN